MKRYSKLLRILEQEPHYQLQFSALSGPLFNVRAFYFSAEGTVWLFYVPTYRVEKKAVEWQVF